MVLGLGGVRGEGQVEMRFVQTAKKGGDCEGNCQSCREEGVVERGCREK